MPKDDFLDDIRKHALEKALGLGEKLTPSSSTETKETNQQQMGGDTSRPTPQQGDVCIFKDWASF